MKDKKWAKLNGTISAKVFLRRSLYIWTVTASIINSECFDVKADLSLPHIQHLYHDGSPKFRIFIELGINSLLTVVYKICSFICNIWLRVMTYKFLVWLWPHYSWRIFEYVHCPCFNILKSSLWDHTAPLILYITKYW